MKLLGLFVALVAVAVLRLFVGVRFGWPSGDWPGAVWRVLGGGWLDRGGGDSVLGIRLARLVLAVLVGWSLAASGVALQSLLRNPLAEPFILGLSSGAGVGVMGQMLAGGYLGYALGSPHIGALLGAGGSMLIVYAAGRKRGVIDPLGLLLVGVVLSTINGAVIVLLSYLPGSAVMRDNLARWMMGYLNEALIGTPTVLIMGLVAAGGFGLLLANARAMDVAAFSDAEADSLGVDLRRLRRVLFVVASALAGGSVVLAGPIAFVGLICPHGVRLVLGPGHRGVLLGSAMVGAVLILLADIASVSLDFGQGWMPLGVFTAVLGGPAFVWMLRPQLGRGIA